MAAVEINMGKTQMKCETRTLTEKGRWVLFGAEIRCWCGTLKWLVSRQGNRGGHRQEKHMNQQRLRILINRPTTNLAEKTNRPWSEQIPSFVVISICSLSLNVIMVWVYVWFLNTAQSLFFLSFFLPSLLSFKDIKKIELTSNCFCNTTILM